MASFWDLCSPPFCPLLHWCQPIVKKKKEGEEKRMTQEEMLLEAAETGFKLRFPYILSKSTLVEFVSIGCVVLNSDFVCLPLPMFPEIMNMRNLERVLAREEEVKKKAVVHKDTYDGPTIRFFSRDGNCFCQIVICIVNLKQKLPLPSIKVHHILGVAFT